VTPAEQIRFRTSQRAGGSAETSIRVTLPFPRFGLRTLPVTDHHLLTRAEQQVPRPGDRAEVLDNLVRKMGDTVAVRLGLSRPFAGEGQPPVCWLLANGFFSLTEPRP
jgi:hypothetical protein